MPYDLDSSDRRAHITNLWVQKGGVAGDESLRGGAAEGGAEELLQIEDIEMVSSRWPEYNQ